MPVTSKEAFYQTMITDHTLYTATQIPRLLNNDYYT